MKTTKDLAQERYNKLVDEFYENISWMTDEVEPNEWRTIQDMMREPDWSKDNDHYNTIENSIADLAQNALELQLILGLHPEFLDDRSFINTLRETREKALSWLGK